MDLKNTRERFLTIMSTKLYTALEPAELNELYEELMIYMKRGDVHLSEAQNMSLMEMLFYLNVYMSCDVNAKVIYNSLRDRLGERSAKLYVMNATLMQINENDIVALKYLEKLINEEYEFDSDPASYGIIMKKILAIKFELSKAGKLDKENDILKESIDLVEKLPLDPELWWYLGETYYKAGQLDEAKYCFEEVVLIMPFNYVGFAKVAEVTYYKALQSKDKESLLDESLKNALRSVELSGLYLKGWSFVAVTSKALGNKQEVLSLATNKIQEIQNVSNSRDKIAAEFIIKEMNLVK
ncbi:similar to Saccharomyces cerevisiae YJR088C EMC2 Member of a transmembrane complex required for efficient folding of proteins in the ER [Maudiozyma barnettii]|uniref:ER membrane protein complex subunit 2 n=1 Tax=Maudiozyma barnettii TaxID=61262 RepID=A0A8H2ZHY5_9SACH|nr:Emc2p [Kazachstania barnettii]CAB4254972.1 similar to Saccharomyces cerevisiae YJR088C EMC2 Member of a transmembrane complex required for efficient folding of proteins in the ER [Kazachstania barnettii]CAD1783243.1 similar to Saccharomyces cerevisiae YJR088C EMC2 Member of a transmembrane complex required for efficient folding of proteins in the ER [Kazachstania barnettii]